MKVMKFGGTSVGKPERMNEIVKLITKDDEPKIVVLSALSGTTNSLSEISNSLSKGERPSAKQHIDALVMEIPIMSCCNAIIACTPAMP